MDGIAKDGVVMGCAIHEHVENAGVHSGIYSFDFKSSISYSFISFPSSTQTQPPNPYPLIFNP
jgi:hypothetical protein